VHALLLVALIAQAGTPKPLGGGAAPPNAEVRTGLAAKHPGDAGLAGEPAVLFASGFEQGFDGWTRSNRKVCAIDEGAQVAHSGAKCLRITATRGVDTGGETTWRLARGVDELYLRLYCKFAEDACWPHHFVKLRAQAPGWDGPAGVAPPGDKGFWTGIEPLRGAWRFYTYWHRMRGFNNPGGDVAINDDGTKNTGANDFYGNTFQPAAQPPIPRGQWICVEAMLKANTPGKQDGAMAFWIDGVELGRYAPGTPSGTWVRNEFVTGGERNTKPAPFPGFDFRTTDALKVSEIALLWYVSEEYAAKGTATKNVVWFDDVVVATEYVGPRTAVGPR
jgi:hypothetical protein